MLLNLSSPFAVIAKKPRNYRGRLTYVNLETASTAIRVRHFSYIQHLNPWTSRQVLDALLNPTRISFTINTFRGYNHSGYDSALMHDLWDSFAIRKPSIWCRKDED